jgi:hypothetical protein
LTVTITVLMRRTSPPPAKTERSIIRCI